MLGNNGFVLIVEENEIALCDIHCADREALFLLVE